MQVTRSQLSLLGAALCLIAATPYTTGELRLRDGSRLWFDGTSSLRSWSCTADTIDATIISSKDGVVAAVLDGRKVAGTVKVDFPVAKLECKHGTMNEHMGKALKAREFGVISFALTTYDLAKTGAVAGTLQGTLQMAGQSKPIAVPVEFAPAPDGALRVTGKVPVRMTEWGVKRPPLMLGNGKVGPVVTVHFDVQLQQGAVVAHD